MSEYFPNNCWVFDTGNDVHGSTNAVGAGMRRNGNLYIATTFATSLTKSRRLQAMSISNTRFKRFAHVIEACFSAGVWSFRVLPVFPLPRFAGVTSDRYLLLGAKTPWKRVRFTRGLGTSDTSLDIKSSGSNMT